MADLKIIATKNNQTFGLNPKDLEHFEIKANQKISLKIQMQGSSKNSSNKTLNKIDWNFFLTKPNSKLDIILHILAKKLQIEGTIKIFHQAENTISNINVKIVCQDGATVLLDGLIDILPNCNQAKSDFQVKGLLLDSKSGISCKPNLNIEHKNVTCSHGLGIGGIPQKYSEYLSCRGVDFKKQKILYTKAFLS